MPPLAVPRQCKSLTLFQTGSGMTLSDGGGPLWPSLIFCYITQQKVALTPKTCSQIKFLIFRHPFTPLFQHSRESFPPFMSVNVNQHLDIEILKIEKTPPLEMKRKFLSPILMKFQTCNPYGLRISHRKFEWNWRQKIFPDSKGGTLWWFFKNQKNNKGFFWKKKIVSDLSQILRVRSWDLKDFRFWVSSKKFFLIFSHFHLMLEDPQKFSTSHFSNLIVKNVKSSFIGS